MSSDTPSNKAIAQGRERGTFLRPKERKLDFSPLSSGSDWVFTNDSTSKAHKLIKEMKLKAKRTPRIVRKFINSTSPESCPSARPKYKNAPLMRISLDPESTIEDSSEKRDKLTSFIETKAEFLTVQKSSIRTIESELTKKKKINEYYCLSAEILEKLRHSQKKNTVVIKKKNQLRKKTPIIINYPPVILKKNLPRKPESVSIKEAIKDRDWLLSAKDQILNDIAVSLNKSNGVVLTRPEEPYFSYKYFLGPGNNSPLVRQILSGRPGWTLVSKEERHKAHFVWTQWKDLEFLNSLPVSTQTPRLTSTAKLCLVCTSKFGQSSDKTVEMTQLGYDDIFLSSSFALAEASPPVNCSDLKIHNRLEGNSHLANKKGLYHNLRRYYAALDLPLEAMPLTFHIQDSEDPNYQLFKCHFAANEESGIPNIWILKPGENSNRGCGISICTNLEQIDGQVKAFSGSKRHTAIVQQYLHNPFLIYKRKFDIRCFALITCYNGVLQAYFYSEGYLRTTSSIYSISNISNKFIHLTNDAVQQKSSDYGKYENGNKMSFNDFQKYLDNYYEERKINFCNEILPLMKDMVKDTVKATFLKLNPCSRAYSFEVLGYDFLLDSNLRPWLLEVNTNPCLELSSPQLARIIPAMLENAFKIAIDPLFQEPNNTKRTSNAQMNDTLFENKFQLVFHSLTDGVALCNELVNKGTLGEIQGSEDDHFEEENYNIFSEED